MMYGIAAAAKNARLHHLTKTEEVRLHSAYMAGDDAAGRRLVTSFLPMLMRAARGYDAIGVAVAAFMENIARYDPAKETRLWTYLSIPVTQAVLAYRLDQKTFFQLKGARQRKAAVSLEAEKKKIGASGRPLTDRETRILANVFGISESLIHGMDDDMSIMKGDPLKHDRSDHHGTEDPERVGGHLDFERRHDHERMMKRLEDALTVLGEREIELVARRFKDVPDQLRKVGDDMGISAERVRQIEARAILKLRGAMEASGRQSSRQPIPHGLGFPVSSALTHA